MSEIINSDSELIFNVNFVKALAALQLEMKSVKKSTENTFFKSKYADLAAVCDYVYPLLAKHGLAISQPSVLLNDKLYIKTILMHESGGFMQAIWPVTGAKQQELGSATSYARRYSLMSITGLSASGDAETDVEDDDGNSEIEFEALPKNKNKMIMDLKEMVSNKKIEPATIVNFNLEKFKKAKINDLDVSELETLINWLKAKGE